MRQRLAKNARTAILFAVVLPALFIAWLPTTAGAVQSDINVSICSDQLVPAGVTIDEPRDDSVVGQSVITLRGTAANSSQLEIEVDEQYVTTLAIGAGQATYETTLTLEPGTHTITVVATAICGGEDANDSVVITYQPETQPSSGDGTPTQLDGTRTLDGTPDEQASIDSDSLQMILGIPVIGSAVGIVSDFAASTGLTATVTGNNTPVIAGVARVGLTVAAMSSIVMASSLAPVAVRSIGGLSELFSIKSHRSMSYLSWIIRGVGVLTLALAYFI